ncbi:MAG: portal protein [Alphaproteobacteria bacterium]
MSQSGNPFGGQIEEAMGAGGPALDPATEAAIEIEGQVPGLTDEVLEDMVLQMNEDGSAEFLESDPTEVLTEEYSHTANLAEILDDSILGSLASDLGASFDDDMESRSEWEEALTKGLGLLGINYEERDEPFAGATGVTHPLISESVTQFQAQAYKEMLPAGGPVRTICVGDETPEAVQQAQRVEQFMNYQVMEVMEEYDPDMDQMLFHLPLSGSTFKKVYFDLARQRAVSKFVPAEDVVVPYYATDIRTAERITHVMKMSDNDIVKMQLATVYRDVDLGSSGMDDEGDLQDKKDQLQGVRPSAMGDDVYTILEIQTYLDLEGFEDTDADGEPTGLKLPYVVTMEKDSGTILSIVRNWDEEDEQRKPLQSFVHYKFLPGLGFYGFGLIHMIGGLSRAATSILRQLIDAGTLSNLPAGFKARGVRIRNDDEPLNPGEFRDIDAPGGDLRNAIVPLPYKEPSGTLGQLLGVIVDSGRRYAAIADNAMGDVNTQAPVGTTVALLERGSRVMSAIHKRMHYAQRQEFRLLASIFADTVEAYPYATAAGPQIVQADFDGRVDVLPVSDPNIFSMAQRLSLAQTQLQMAQSNPDIHNLQEAYRRMYEALEVKNIEALLPAPPQTQPIDPAMEQALVLNMKPIQAFPGQNHMAHIQSHITFMQSPMIQGAPQFLGPLMANIQQRIGYMAREQVAEQVAQLGQMMPPEAMEAMVAARVAELSQEIIPSLAPQQQQDPLVNIRQAELQLAAADQQRKQAKDQVDAMLEQARLQQQDQQAYARMALTKDIAEDRSEVNRERIETQEDIAVLREMNKRRQ